MNPAVIMSWVWSIAKLVVDGLLDKSKSTEQVLAEAGIEIAAFKAVMAREDAEAEKQYPDLDR